MPLQRPILLFLLSNHFYWEGAGFFYLIMLKLVINASEENHQCFFFSRSIFRMMGIFARNISVLVSSVW